jgi:hypothetical protein
MGGGAGGVPILGERGASGAALGVGGAMDAELASREPGIAGLGEHVEEAAILGRLHGAEGTRHERNSRKCSAYVLIRNPTLQGASRQRCRRAAEREQRLESAQLGEA